MVAIKFGQARHTKEPITAELPQLRVEITKMT
jgi:hypothetical protein